MGAAERLPVAKSKQVAHAYEDYQIAIELAKKDLVDALVQVLDAATQGGDLDTALEAKDAIQRLEARPPKDAVQFRGHHYKVIPDGRTWHMARDQCKAMGGHLVCIRDQAENDFVSKLVGDGVAWIGFSDEKKEGQWEWVTGEPVKFTAWWPADKQPDNHLEIQNHAFLRAGKGWDDEVTARRLKFVCEWDE